MNRVAGAADTLVISRTQPRISTVGAPASPALPPINGLCTDEPGRETQSNALLLNDPLRNLSRPNSSYAKYCLFIRAELACDDSKGALDGLRGRSTENRRN